MALTTDSTTVVQPKVVTTTTTTSQPTGAQQVQEQTFFNHQSTEDDKNMGLQVERESSETITGEVPLWTIPLTGATGAVRNAFSTVSTTAQAEEAVLEETNQELTFDQKAANYTLRGLAHIGNAVASVVITPFELVCVLAYQMYGTSACTVAKVQKSEDFERFKEIALNPTKPLDWYETQKIADAISNGAIDIFKTENKQ